jgi:hypothetical protein
MLFSVQQFRYLTGMICSAIERRLREDIACPVTIYQNITFWAFHAILLEQIMDKFNSLSYVNWNNNDYGP